ncbi:type II secretion system protein [Candidatus Roizmanbacteria bacterium]|nr:type II secretion system protein [Candidatus Roizmanbacteria bacterium]
MEDTISKEKSSMKQFSIQKGFTLVELLVAVGVFVTISNVVIGVLFSTLRASRKSEVLLNLKQNGDTALTQMVANIRYAKSLDDPISCVTPVTQMSITVTSSSDDGQTTYSCPMDPTFPIASNSAALIDTSSVLVRSCSFTCTQTADGNPPTITIQFILDAALSAGFVETTGSIPFQTSVTMRNFSR